MSYKNFEDLTVIIPTRNEAVNITKVTEGLIEKYPGLSIVVSDDGSEDGTLDAVANLQKNNKNIMIIDRKNEEIKGLTVSVLDAIEKVKTRYFIVMDGDGQHDSKYVGLIYGGLRQNGKICVASRALVPHWPLNRKIISFAGALLGKLVLSCTGKTYPPDILSGFFGMETGYWRSNLPKDKAAFSLEGYKILFDFLKHRHSNDKPANVYYEFNSRYTGTSKINRKVYAEFLKSLFGKRA